MRNSIAAVTAALALHSIFSIHSAAALEDNSPTGDVTNEYSFPACTDISGEQAKYVSRDDIDITPGVAYAGARYLDAETQSGPLIIYNQNFYDNLSPVQRDFTFAHECAHLNTGDAVQAYRH